tara:strand:+ start:682 stop:1083 length:402 start_codon:yes stop_codon:yes gene_type:complete
MQSICVKNDEGKYILLTMNPEEGDFVIKKNIEKLVPIMKTHCNKFINNFNDINIYDGNINFKNSSVSDIYQILKICIDKISEKIIVSQYTSRGPEIRHRPLYFGLNDNETGIQVKFTKLGEFNTIEKAIEYLS